MSGPIVKGDLERSETGRLNDSHSIPGTNPRNDRRVHPPFSEEPAETERHRIQEDSSTIVALSGNAVRGSHRSPTSTTTRRSADEGAAQAQRDKERILALKLLDLEWTSLSPEMQQSVVGLLHALTNEL
jgi:hypothetical protein